MIPSATDREEWNKAFNDTNSVLGAMIKAITNPAEMRFLSFMVCVVVI